MDINENVEINLKKKEKKMSTLENTELKERVFEDLEIALETNDCLTSALASKLLDGVEYYLYFKEDHWELLFDYEDIIYEKVWEAFLNTESVCWTAEELCCRAFDIDLD